MSYDENAFRTQSFHVSQKGSLANLFENSNKREYSHPSFVANGENYCIDHMSLSDGRSSPNRLTTLPDDTVCPQTLSSL